jgi:cytochrome c oxidase subunit 4
MLDAGWLNIASLILGLIAWTLPVINLVQYNKSSNRKWVIFSITSISACGISLYMQILYTDHLVKINDLSALMDTSGGVVSITGLLLVVTIMLNLVTLLLRYRKNQ